jgi:hypothetical protein
MARIKTNFEVENQIKFTRQAIEKNTLTELAKDVDSNKEHPLNKPMNSYPKIPFEISACDLEKVQMLKSFPDPHPKEHQWTPLEKIFYALLWKAGKLESIKRIIEGAEKASNNTPSAPDRAVVYHYFGRHLVNRLQHPVIDQHTTRAFLLLTNLSVQNLDNIRTFDSPTKDHARKYCTWYNKMLVDHNIISYDDSRKIDCYLFALGKYAKKRKG